MTEVLLLRISWQMKTSAYLLLIPNHQSPNDEKPMIDEEVEPGIKMLADQYPNFFYVQLPEFHFKNVIEVKGDQKILFSGKFSMSCHSMFLSIKHMLDVKKWHWLTHQ